MSSDRLLTDEDFLESLKATASHFIDDGDPESGARLGSEYWTRLPVTSQEVEVYYGYHSHSQDNPLGLHAHIPGRPLAGGHTHGPQNRFGAHYHGEMDPVTGKARLDGDHIHSSTDNMPSGPHGHDAANFG